MRAATLKFLEHRIGDPRILRLISRMSKGGIMEDGLVEASEKGTRQGSILSPLLSNIYLHYALDLWFSRRFKGQCRGEAYYFRFADDFLACFQYKADAESFMNGVRNRLEDFSLELAPEKTRCIEFGRYARENARKQGAILKCEIRVRREWSRKAPVLPGLKTKKVNHVIFKKCFRNSVWSQW